MGVQEEAEALALGILRAMGGTYLGVLSAESDLGFKTAQLGFFLCGEET